MEKELFERPNDPTKVDNGPARPAIVRSTGGTPSERYLAKLADRSFLNLWSYPNTFIDKRKKEKGDGNADRSCFQTDQQMEDFKANTHSYGTNAATLVGLYCSDAEMKRPLPPVFDGKF